MLNITRVDHLGIRISDLERSREFYERLGFQFIRDAGFREGHPVIMKHPGGVVVNLLGPSTEDTGTNILMDVDAKYSGYTHASLRIESIEAAKAALEGMGIEITGGPFRFTDDMVSMFIRDPDRNVIELTEHGGKDLGPGYGQEQDFSGYTSHP